MKAPGKMVKVNDTLMHVYSITQSATRKQSTMVFLSGSGTECPTYDFKPLWRLLADQYHIAVVERPGYGWSGLTEYPRDIDTILEETREALRQADIPGPFIPAAHSLAGLEAIYWAWKYPEEISAIIGLDMAVPQIYNLMQLPRFLSLPVQLAHFLRRPIAYAMIKSHPAVKKHILTKEEQASMHFTILKQLLSKNMIDDIQFIV